MPLCEVQEQAESACGDGSHTALTCVGRTGGGREGEGGGLVGRGLGAGSTWMCSRLEIQ